MHPLFSNTFFAARNPSISVNTFCARASNFHWHSLNPSTDFDARSFTEVLAFPLAKAMEFSLPTKSITLFGKQWSLNPGKFSVKEHMLISIMANVTFGGGIGGESSVSSLPVLLGLIQY